MTTLEEKERRRRLEDQANMSLYDRFSTGFGSMFDPAVDPNAPRMGDVVGGMPSLPNTRTTNMLMGGSSVDAMGNVVPGANARTSVLGVPVPEYAKPTATQGITLNPAYTPNVGNTGMLADMLAPPPIYSVYDEFNRSGEKDFSFSRLFGGAQERSGVSAFEKDLSASGKEKFNRINKGLQAIPRSNMEKRTAFINKKENQFNVLNDFNTAGKAKFGVEQNAKGKDVNMYTGGILQGGGTAPVNLDARLPSFQDKNLEGIDAGGGAFRSTGVTSKLPGSTVQQTIDDSGMQLINNGQVAIPTRESLQYTGNNVPFMSPAIKADMDASGIGVAGYQNILDNYVKKAPVDETSFMDSLGGVTGMVGLLGDIMLMQSLLDNKTQTPAASAPRGLVGSKNKEDDPYRRSF